MAALQATCLPSSSMVPALLQTSRKWAMPQESVSVRQTRTKSRPSSGLFLLSRQYGNLPIFISTSTAQKQKATGIAYARSSGQMDHILDIRFDEDASFTSEPHGDKQLKVSVSLTGKATRRAFDSVLENLRRSAPPVQGFRKAKGGKSVVPRDVLYQMLGPSRVDKFVLEEIVSSSVLEYVEKVGTFPLEGIKAKKKDFETVQTHKELGDLFKAGENFGFEAIIDLEDEEPEAAKVEES